MNLVLLADHQASLSKIARWYCEEWGHLREGTSHEKMIKNLHSYLNKDKVPLMVLAMEGAETVGVAQLKFREMDIYPEKEHWLGGVFVSPEHRGNKTASKIVVKILAIAASLNIEYLYLQTEKLNGGLYPQLGWKPLEQVNYDGVDVLVMENKVLT
ncbi:MAG: GNAT family N-acetyltransferase [SAR324 cluster bacterium]|nr:GNAT family N-acetyltransferase [SAR324 cluster bacterium]